MKIWTVFIDNKPYYATCNHSEAVEMYNALAAGIEEKRIRIESKQVWNLTKTTRPARSRAK